MSRPDAWSVRRLLCVALIAVAALGGCGSARPTHYADFFAGRGEELLDAGWLGDADELEVRLTYTATGQPASGARILVGDGDSGRVFEADRSGIVRLPVSRELLRTNPTARGPSGVSFKVSLSHAATCHDEVRGVMVARSVPRSELDAWRSFPSGSDVVYAEGGVDEERVAEGVRDLGAARSALAQLSGTSPPPIAVVFLLRDGPVRFTGDRGGRVVWPVRPKDREGVLQAVVVHEWTHAILRSLTGKVNGDVRYLEEGLCEYMAHRVSETVRGDAGSQTWRERRRELEGARATAPVDVTKQATTLDLAKYESIAKWSEAQCAQENSLGYALAFAFIYERAHGADAWLKDALAGLRGRHDADDWLEILDPKGRAYRLHARDMSPPSALSVLQRGSAQRP